MEQHVRSHAKCPRPHCCVMCLERCVRQGRRSVLYAPRPLSLLISNAALLNAPTVIRPPTRGTKLEQMDLRGAHDISFRTFWGCGGEYKTGFIALGMQEFCARVIRELSVIFQEESIHLENFFNFF
jgi:hypothetical protein